MNPAFEFDFLFFLFFLFSALLSSFAQCTLLGPLVLRSLKLSRLTQNASSDPLHPYGN